MKINILFFFIFLVNSVNAQWQTNGPYGGQVNCFLSCNYGLYVGSSSGLFFSSDSGATWGMLNDDLAGYSVSSLDIDSVYLIAGTKLNGMYLSTDSGTSWTSINAGLSSKNIHLIKVIGSVWYASTQGGFYRSTDKGNSWSLVPGLSPVNSCAKIGDTLFVGTMGGGVFKSITNGESWTPTNMGLANLNVISLAADDSNLFAGTYGSGIFFSSNKGASWSNISSGGLDNQIVNCLLIKENALLAGTRNGIFFSSDNGVTWMKINNGLIYPDILVLTTKGNYFLAGGTETYRSISNYNWSFSNWGINSQKVKALTLDEENVFAGTWGNGVFISADTGNTWSSINNGLTDQYINSLATFSTCVYAGTNNGVFKSVDEGKNWTPTKGVYINGSVVNTLVEWQGCMFAGLADGAFGGGVYYNHLLADYWVDNYTGLTNTDVRALITLGDSLYAGTYGGAGVYCLKNRGGTWAYVKNNGLSNRKVTVLHLKGSYLFAGTDGGGVFLSMDKGNNWVPVNSGLTNFTILSLTSSGRNLYAGTLGSGVFLSTDNGNSWYPYHTGLTNQWIYTLAVKNNFLFAGTGYGYPGYTHIPFGGSSVWRTCLVPSPQISVLGSSIFCKGDSIVLDAGQEYLSYLWSNSSTNAVIKAWTTGNYVVAVTSLCGSGKDSTSIIVQDTIPIVSNIQASICQGNYTMLTASGADSYVWYPSEGLSTTLESTVIASPTASTTYTLISTNTCGSALSEANIIVKPTPNLVVNPGYSSICKGDSVGLSVSGASIYSWYPITGLNTNFGPNVIAFPSTGTKYKITALDSNGCPATIEITLDVNPLPAINTTPDSTICLGDTIMLTATGALDYSWMPVGQSGSSISISPLLTTTYNVIGTDINGCSDSSMVTVTVIPCTNNIIENHSEIQIYPNPNTGTFYLIMKNIEDQELLLNIVRIDGKMIYSETIKSNMNIRKINIEKVSSGIYYLTILQKNKTIVEKLFIQ